jgi:hypothetical protein
MGMDGQGWHNDPSRRHELRWWDGSAWSPYVADGGVVALDEVVPPAPPPRPPAFAPEPIVTSEPHDEEHLDAPRVREPRSSRSARAARASRASRASMPVRAWRAIRARPLWARIAALLVIALAILAVILTGGADKPRGGTVEIRGLAPPPATRPPTSAAPSSAASTTSATERAAPRCDRNYDPCVPIASDVDCAHGPGNGPAYVDGPVRVVGSDVYHLDPDRDGVGCD